MDQGTTPEQALILAVNRMGSQAAMARLCDVAQPSVWHWLNESKQLPAEHVLKVEAATRVARHDLRPDIYPRGLQDDVPFSPDSSAPTAGELSGATPEWPLAPPADSESGNRADEFQSSSAGKGSATASGDDRTQPGAAHSADSAAAGTIGERAAVDEAQGSRPAAALAAQGDD